MNQLIFLFIGFITSFIVSYAAIPTIIRVAKLKHLYDEPDTRKSHTSEVPTLGGMAIFAGFALSSLLWCNCTEIPELQYLIASVTIIFIIGVKDDILVTAPMTKLTGQIIAVVILIVFGDIRFTHLHGFFGIEEIGYSVSFILTLFTMLVIINGFNFIDGIDGLASGTGIITTITFGLWFLLNGHTGWVVICFSLVGALLAFFRYNIFSSDNKIFMGDAGALLVGLLSSVLVIKFNECNIDSNFQYAVSPAPSVSFGILIVPLYDMIQVVFIRTVKRKGIYKADKNHVHHRLINFGYSHRKATFIILGVNIVFIVLSFWLSGFMSIRRLALLLLILAIIVSNITVIFNWRKT